MTRGEYNTYRGWQIPADEKPEDGGYLLKYPDGYVSWSPKEIFERAYLQVDDNENLPSGVSIGQKMVEEFVAYTETMTLGDRTTVVRCVLRNGFEIVVRWQDLKLFVLILNISGINWQKFVWKIKRCWIWDFTEIAME